MSADVVIIGGGIVGCSCAYYLSRAGLKVRLLERGPLGSGTSRAGMSHIITWEEPDAHLELARASQKLYETLADELTPAIEYRRTGSLAVVEEPQGLPPMISMLARLQAAGIQAEFLDSHALAEFEPRLASGLAGGAFFPADGMVNPLLTTLALARAAAYGGAVLSTHTPVTSIELASNNSFAAVHTAEERIPATVLVITAGVWTAELAVKVGGYVPIRPRKGHLIITQPLPQDLLRCKVILSSAYMDSVHGADGNVSVAGNIQQVANGNLLLGSSRQFAGIDLSVDARVVSEIVRRCIRLLPFLAGQAALRTWSGLRPSTPDLLPVIGALSQTAGIYVAAGHEGIGITEAPITGLLISQMISGQPLSLSADRFSPARFHPVQQK
jgi:D-hydroxyproline dehydrogenase subunit beta